MKREFNLFDLFIVVGVASLLMAPAALALSDHDTQQEEYAVWDCSAPFGHYYTDINGFFVFGTGGIDSEFQEAYVIKYLIGNELKTIIFTSTDPVLKVIFQEGEPRLVEEWEQTEWFQVFTTHDRGDGSTWTLYLPDPHLTEVVQ